MSDAAFEFDLVCYELRKPEGLRIYSTIGYRSVLESFVSAKFRSDAKPQHVSASSKKDSWYLNFPRKTMDTYHVLMSELEAHIQNSAQNDGFDFKVVFINSD